MLRKATLAALCFALLATSAFAEPPKTGPTNKRSAVITTGNTFQTIMAAMGDNESRNSLTIQNNNTTSTDNCWIVVGGTLGSATKGTAILLIPGASYTRYYPFVPSDAIHATCVTSANTIYADTQ
jgi:hypothetical protein